MLRLFSTAAFILILVAGMIAGYERMVPITKYIDYHAVVGLPIYFKAPTMDFFSVATNDRVVRRVEWLDAIFCQDTNTGQFVQLDSNGSSVNNKKPQIAPASLIQIAKERPSDNVTAFGLAEWSKRIVVEAKNVGKRPWQYQTTTLKWPEVNTLCYGQHTITALTTHFGFRRSTTLNSPTFWLIGTVYRNND